MCSIKKNKAAANRVQLYLKNDLISDIDKVVNDKTFIQNELSERLATAGLLPMFGFPTKVRSLFKQDENFR